MAIVMHKMTRTTRWQSRDRVFVIARLYGPGYVIKVGIAASFVTFATGLATMRASGWAIGL